jgi:putative protease
MFGVRTKENVVAAKDVLAQIALTTKDEPDRWPLDMTFTLRAGEPATLTILDSATELQNDDAELQNDDAKLQNDDAELQNDDAKLLNDSAALQNDKAPSFCAAGAESISTPHEKESIRVTVQGPAPEAAITAELTEERLRASLAKLGGTPDYLNDLTAHLEGGLMLRSADLNELRRAAVQEIAEKRSTLFARNRKPHRAAEAPHYMKNERGSEQFSRTTRDIRTITPLHSAESATFSTKGILRLRIRVRDAAQLTPHMMEKADAVIAPLGAVLELAGIADRFSNGEGKLAEAMGQGQGDVWMTDEGVLSKLIAELPAVVFDDNTVALRQSIQSLLRRGVRHFSAGNLYALEMLGHNTGRMGNEGAGEIVLHGDSGLNITNAVSMHDYLSMGLADVTLSPELSKQRILALGARAGILAYGYLPLMQLRNCPAQPCPGSSAQPNLRSAASPGTGATASSNDWLSSRPCGLTDRLGKCFPLSCGDGITTLHNCVPLYIGDKLAQFKDRSAFYTLYFTIESPKECEAVTRSFLAGERLDRETTGGLYFR